MLNTMKSTSEGQQLAHCRSNGTNHNQLHVPKSRFYKELSSAEKEEIQFGYAESTTVYRVALFEPKEYDLKHIAI